MSIISFICGVFAGAGVMYLLILMATPKIEGEE